MKLHSKLPCFPVTTFVICLYIVFAAQSALANPSISNWSIRLHTKYPDQSHEMRNLETTSAVPRTFRGFVEYTADINISEIDHQIPLGIYLGQIAEADEVHINGKLIGSMGAFPPHYTNFMDVDRIYLLPPHLLHPNKNNLLRIVVYTEYFVKKGLNISNVKIGPIAQLQQKQYFSTVSWNLTRLILPSLCFLLIILSFSAFRTKGGLHASLLLLLASSFFVFGVSRSRLTFHIFDLLTSYKILTLSSVTGACILAFFASQLARPKQWLWPTLACAITVLYWILILPQEDIGSVSNIYVPSWYYVGTGLLFACSLFLAPQMLHKYRIVAFGIWILTLLGVNDTLEMLFRIDTPLLFDIGMSLFLCSLIIERIFDMKNELVKAHKEQAYFVSQQNIARVALQVAHDIRSPLSSLQVALGYLGNIAITDPKAPEVLNLLELSAKRLTGIADDLLKKHKGGGENNKVIFSLHHILDELVGEYQGREEFKGLKFVKGYASQAIELYGDRAKLQRAFGNIIKNAVEAMKGRGIVTFSTAKPNGKIEVSIADTGPGIPADKLARILEGGYTEGKKDGHGIGTKVVKETVTEFGGQITAASELGKGTAFVIELPLPSVAENRDAQREKTAMESFTLDLASEGGDPVLVVDDDAGMREQWRLIFKDHGMGTILCESYEDFERQELSSKITQTAIIDYHYDNSEKNGADIIRSLQKKGFTNLYLCTAEYWKPSVQKLANDLSVKLCPKPLPKIRVVSVTNIFPSPPPSPTRGEGVSQASKNSGYTVLVIDDDEGIRMSWEMMQERLGIKQLRTYSNLEALQKEPLTFPDVDIAFVDKNIEGSDYDGAYVVNYLKSRGIPKVVLASGEREEELRKDSRFSQIDFIIGKTIPKDFKAFFS